MFTLEEAEKIKQALKLCGHKSGCEKCSYNNVKYCQDSLNTDAYNLILEYEEAIEQLEAETDKQYEQAEADILGNMADGGISCHWCINKHKEEAVKCYIKLLKKDIKYFVPNIADINEVIDNCFKELFDDSKNR